ncbi:MAG: hypothetical protein JNM46_10475, partial [Anaerolineales bacterium]|nr:hypothetical protein [Anaerolineales bacterium]
MKYLLNQRLVLSWLLSIPVTYFALAFLDIFYTHPLEAGLLVVILHTLITFFIYLLIRKVKKAFRIKPKEGIFAFLIFVSLIIFWFRLILMAGRFPLLFDSSYYLLNVNLYLSYYIGWCISLFVSSRLFSIAHSKDLLNTRFYTFVNANLNGIVIALAFFSIYFLLANIFNQPLFNFDDIFFDTDAKLYRARFGTENYEDVYWRTVHPFILIVVRP